MFTAILAGIDVTDYVTPDNFTWNKEDLDSQDAGRTLDGIMHRARISEKRNYNFTLQFLPYDIAQRLAIALDNEQQYTATLFDLIKGTYTGTFYTSKISTNGFVYHDNKIICVTSMTFPVIEI